MATKRKGTTRTSATADKIPYTRGEDLASLGGDAGDGRSFEDYLMEALDLTREQFDENREAIDEMIETGVPAYDIAGDEANLSNMFILTNMIRKEKDLPPVTVEKFVGDYESQAAKAGADPEAIAAQKRALTELEERIDPQITDKEKALFEVSRRAQEQELRGAREAALSSARGRGLGGVGMEFQAGLSAQQEGSERRMLEDLATSGMAIDRSERALRDFGGLAGQIRGQSFEEEFRTGSAADMASRFNKTIRQDYDMFKTNTQAQENRDRWGRTMDVSGAQFGAVSDKYNRGLESQRLRERGLGLKVGASTQGTGQVVSILKEIAGAKQAEEAAKKLTEEPEDEGLLGLGFDLGPITL